MHRERVPRDEQREGLRRPDWVEVAAAEGRAPASDRHDREVERWRGQLGHLREDLGVSGEVDAVLALDHVPEGSGGWSEREAHATVAGPDRRDRQGADLDAIPQPNLDDVLKAAGPHQPAATRG